jgi:dihydroorotate dehydrogenase
VAYLHQKSKGQFPIIGVGGIHSGADAVEKLKAGAALVQIYSGFIYAGPGLIKEINKEIIAAGL